MKQTHALGFLLLSGLGFTSAAPVEASPTGCCIVEVNTGQVCNFVLSCVCRKTSSPYNEETIWGNVISSSRIKRKIVGHQDSGNCNHPSVWIPDGSNLCSDECINMVCTFSSLCGDGYHIQSCDPNDFWIFCSGAPGDYCNQRTRCVSGDCPHSW